MNLQYRVEAALVRAAIGVLRMLPPAAASNLGGALARTIGPLIPVSRVADDNLRHAFPDLDAASRRRLVRGVWDNLGRTAAELPHVGDLKRTESGPGWEIDGEDCMPQVAANGGPVLLLSGHIGNWEMLPVMCDYYGIRMSSFYRAAANPVVDAILTELRMRALGGGIPMFNKGGAGARAARGHLARGGYLGMLIDQKMNEGIPSPLFGRLAMTTTAAAVFATHFRCPIVFGHVRRLGPARFRLIARLLPLPDSGNRSADVTALTHAINAELEARIRSYPEGWLWLHRRWPKEPLADPS